MGHDKLRKFAENETFPCLLQPSSRELLSGGFFNIADHQVKGNWDSRMFGGSGNPIVLELGCGRGEYTIALAERNPDINYIGVDIKGARLWKGAKYATEHGMKNVAFLRTRIEFITAFFAPGEISQIWLTFSDPQMHSENSRLTSPLFLERYRKFLKPGGTVHLKTDSRFLYEYTSAVCRANGLRVLALTTDLYGERPGRTTPGPAKANGESPVRGGGVDSTSGRRNEVTVAECRSDASAGPGDNSQPDGFGPELFEVQTFYEKMFLEQGYRITYLRFLIDRDGQYVHPEFDEIYWREQEGPRRSFGHSPKKTNQTI